MRACVRSVWGHQQPRASAAAERPCRSGARAQRLRKNAPAPRAVRVGSCSDPRSRTEGAGRAGWHSLTACGRSCSTETVARVAACGEKCTKPHPGRLRERLDKPIAEQSSFHALSSFSSCSTGQRCRSQPGSGLTGSLREDIRDGSPRLLEGGVSRAPRRCGKDAFGRPRAGRLPARRHAPLPQSARR